MEDTIAGVQSAARVRRFFALGTGLLQNPGFITVLGCGFPALDAVAGQLDRGESGQHPH